MDTAAALAPFAPVDRGIDEPDPVRAAAPRRRSGRPGRRTRRRVGVDRHRRGRRPGRARRPPHHQGPGLGADRVGPPRGRARTTGGGAAVADHPGRPGPRRAPPGPRAAVHGAPAAGALRPHDRPGLRAAVGGRGRGAGRSRGGLHRALPRGRPARPARHPARPRRRRDGCVPGDVHRSRRVRAGDGDLRRPRRRGPHATAAAGSRRSCATGFPRRSPATSCTTCSSG